MQSFCRDDGIFTGRDGLVHEAGPGLFLQGLASYGPDGAMLPGPSLSTDVVRACFDYAAAEGIGCTAFLGDTCVTLQLDEYLEKLHTRYFEPLAQVRIIPCSLDTCTCRVRRVAASCAHNCALLPR